MVRVTSGPIVLFIFKKLTDESTPMSPSHVITFHRRLDVAKLDQELKMRDIALPEEYTESTLKVMSDVLSCSPAHISLVFSSGEFLITLLCP